MGFARIAIVVVWHNGRLPSTITRQKRCMGFWTGRPGIAGTRLDPTSPRASALPPAPRHGVSSLGALAGAPSPISWQKGNFTSSALLPLASTIPQRYGKRLLLTLQQRGLTTLGDRTYASLDGPRQWLPLDIHTAILPFPRLTSPPSPQTTIALPGPASSGS